MRGTWPLLRTVAVAASAAILSACVFLPGPQVDCQSVSADGCNRAIDMARPLLSSQWGNAGQVTVHPGSCARGMPCPQSVAVDQRFLTVELTSDAPTAPFVVIDHQGAVWTARCSVLVSSSSGAHTESCAR